METTYRTILSRALDDRLLANPGYSLRAFARDLDLPPSTLSEVLNGKKGVSPKRSDKIARRLQLPEWQIQFFCDLVAKEHAKSPKARQEAKRRLKERSPENQMHLLQQSALRALTSWVDLAILEITYLKDFQPHAAWIANKLGVEERLVRSSVDRLEKAALLKIDRKTDLWVDASPFFSSTDGIPNESIRLFHKTVLQLALKKLDSADLESRTVKSAVFSISRARAPRAKKILDDALSKIVALADESGQEREDVMCFSAQIFSLLKPERTSK